MVPLLVLSMIIVCITVDSVLQRSARRRHQVEAGVAAMSDSSARVPDGIRASSKLEHLPMGVFVGPGHTWIHLERSGAVRIGVDMLPVTLLGGVDSVETIPAGKPVREGDVVATLKRGDRSIELRSPVDGFVDGVNESVLRAPENLRRCHDHECWIVRVAPGRLANALRGMVVGEDADRWLLREDLRLRDLASRRVGRSRDQLGDPSASDVSLEGLANRLDERQWQGLIDELIPPGGSSSASDGGSAHGDREARS